MNLEGVWSLKVATPFGEHPAQLTFERDEDQLTGRIDSRLGTTQLEELAVTGDEFTAKGVHEVQGRPYDATISGSVNGDHIEGTIKVKLPFAPPVRFKGERAA